MTQTPHQPKLILMMSVYFKPSLRHLRKTALYSLINIIGLSTGITAMLLALLFWRHEESFDRFHSNHSNIYRITTSLKENKDLERETVGATGQVQGPAFIAAVPELKSYTRVMGGDIFTDLTINGKTLHLRPLYVDTNFLSVFTFPVIAGDNKSALRETNYVVLTKTTALKFFGTINVVGKVFTTEADPSFERLGKPLMVSAVVNDPPENSSLQFDLLFPFSYMQLAFTDEAWLNAYLGTFVVLDPKADTSQVIKKFNDVYAVHSKEQLSESMRNYGFNPEIVYGLQNIADIHLEPLARSRGNIETGVINVSKPLYSIVFMVVAGFMLLMASINFINISIAGSLKRSKEVGIRKISGGSRRQIVLQFLSESSVLCFISFLFAALAMYLLLPLFNDLTGKHFQLKQVFNTSVLSYFMLLFFLLIASTGLYPAFVLARFKPAEVLYNKLQQSGNNIFGRFLVVLQFTPAIILLIGALVYYRQMDFIRQKDLGYNPDHIIRTSVNGDRDYRSITSFLANELQKEPSIKSVSFGNSGSVFHATSNAKKFETFHKTIDPSYISLMEIPLLAGKNISAAPADKNAAIVNEAFVKAAGLQHAIGATVKLDEYYDSRAMTIIGVVKDHHHQSLKVSIIPMIMFMRGEQDAEMWVKLSKNNMKEGIAALEKVYKAAMPSAIFQYNFLDQLNAREFIEEQRWQKVISIATIVSLLICALGLFGLAHLSAYQRVKEIGIRKVLGASVMQVVVLMSSRFLKLVCLSFVIACPLAWIFMQKWLMNFAYRIDMGAGIFLVAAAFSICVALIAVSGQSFRSALVNPVKSLKSE